MEASTAAKDLYIPNSLYYIMASEGWLVVVLLLGFIVVPIVAELLSNRPKQVKPSVNNRPVVRHGPTVEYSYEPVVQAKPETAIDTKPPKTWNGEDMKKYLSQSPPHKSKVNTEKFLSDMQQTLNAFSVNVVLPRVDDVSIGPRKLGFDLHPQKGQSVSAIERLLPDLSVQLKTNGQIVGHVMPALGAIRLYAPHDSPRPCHLRDALEELSLNSLKVPLGVDTMNKHHSLDIAKAPHVLVGGSTGSGKSVFLETALLSLCINNQPEHLSISILDPKALDFAKYQSLPHVQVYIDDPERCVQHLQWVMQEELPLRKQTLKESGYRQVSEYNEHEDTVIPYRVIIIDEYADLIMAVGDKEAFEKEVCRLAQVGRALGYHIILATQRPSADIVSGKIKTNFPTRIGFRISSATDSKVLLDEGGAQKLHGAGDMIAKLQTQTLYLQGYYVSAADGQNLMNAWEDEEWYEP